MHYNNVPDFLAAIEKRMDELSSLDTVTSATSILDNFTEEELQKFDTIKDEANALCDSEGEKVEFIYNRLLDLGYTDDDITKVLDHEGF